MPKFIKLDGELENVELICTKTDGPKYDFNHFLLPLKFIEKIYNYKITLDKAIEDQTNLKILINKLNGYNPTKQKKIKEKKRVLESARKLSDARDEIINLSEKEIFLYNDKIFKTKEKEESKEELEENKFFKDIENESKGYWPIVLAKELFATKDEKKYNDLVILIMIKWSILKDRIEKMSKNEKNLKNQIKY